MVLLNRFFIFVVYKEKINYFNQFEVVSLIGYSGNIDVFIVLEFILMKDKLAVYLENVERFKEVH